MVAVTHQNGFTSRIVARPANLVSRCSVYECSYSIQETQKDHKRSFGQLTHLFKARRLV
jgi:hypothetical protein